MDCIEIIKSDTVEVVNPQIRTVDVYAPNGVYASSTYTGGNPFVDTTIPVVDHFNLQASPGLTYVELRWTMADYWNHNFTEVWRNTIDNRGTASFVGSSKSNVYVNPAEPSVTYYYWIRHVTYAGSVGDWNALSGIKAIPGLVVANLLTSLEGYLNESQLTSSLTERINGVEVNSGRIDTVVSNQATDYSILLADINTRATAVAVDELATEVNTHDETISAQSQEITTLSTSVGDNNTTLQTMGESVDGLSAQYTVKIDNNGNISGYGLASTLPQADGTESEFTVLADKFSILHPNATDPTDPKLVFTVFEGRTVMDAAYIINLKADYITAGTIDAEVELNAATINAGELNTSTINSSAINNGNFQVDAVGNVDANSIVIRDAGGAVLLSTTGGHQGLGDMADIDKLTPANIDTYISSASIGTLLIGDNAVLLPITVAANYKYVHPNSTNHTPLLEATITNPLSDRDIVIDITAGGYAQGIFYNNSEAYLFLKYKRHSYEEWQTLRYYYAIFGRVDSNFEEIVTIGGGESYYIQLAAYFTGWSTSEGKVGYARSFIKVRGILN